MMRQLQAQCAVPHRVDHATVYREGLHAPTPQPSAPPAEKDVAPGHAVTAEPGAPSAPALAIPQDDEHFHHHRIEFDDTLTKLAVKYGVTEAAIKRRCVSECCVVFVLVTSPTLCLINHE